MNKNAILKDSPQWFHPSCLDNSTPSARSPQLCRFFPDYSPDDFHFYRVLEAWSRRADIPAICLDFFFSLFLMKIFLRVLLPILCWCAEMLCLFQLSGLFSVRSHSALYPSLPCVLPPFHFSPPGTHSRLWCFLRCCTPAILKISFYV